MILWLFKLFLNLQTHEGDRVPVLTLRKVFGPVVSRILGRHKN